MKKRATFVKFALFTALVLCLLALSACSGEGDATTLEFTSNGDGTCYVSGVGDCALEEILIPQVSPKGDRVTAIGDWAFYECFTLKKVTIPDSVTYIGNSAFRGCIYLTDIIIPNSVEFIGEYALRDCKALENIDVDSANSVYSGSGNCLVHVKSKTLIAGCNSSIIPYNGSVTTIADYAFLDFDSISSIDLGDYVTSVGAHAFDSCDNLKTVRIGSSLVSIGDYAFAACDNLKNVSIDDFSNLESIGAFAFHACDDLDSFYFPSSVRTVGEGAFWSCNSFSKAYTDDISAWAEIEFATTSATPLNYGKLYYNNAPVAELVIPEGTKKIGAHAFYNAAGILSVKLPDSVTSIGDYAFANCEGMSVIDFGSSLKTIGEHAFGNCKALSSVSLPKSVESIESYAFFGCGLQNISVEDGNKKYSGNGNCLIDIEAKKLILGTNESQIPGDGSVIGIDNYAFLNCARITEITIPDDIKAIGFKAFDGCSALGNVKFESPTGWVVYKMATDTEGTSVSGTTANLKVSYVSYYWRKK